jgi:hypothetical protein
MLLDPVDDMDLVVAAQKGHHHRFRRARDRSQEPLRRVVFGQGGVLVAKGPFGHSRSGRVEVRITVSHAWPLLVAIGTVLVEEKGS